MNINLVHLKKEGQAKSFTVSSSVITIGRRHDCDLVIPLSVVSRKHCELFMDHGKLMVRDLSSKNGTLVNGHKVEEKPISPGDQIGVGPICLLVQIDGVPNEIAHIEPIAPVVQKYEEEDKPQSNHFEEVVEDLSSAQLGGSQTAEIIDFSPENPNLSN